MLFTSFVFACFLPVCFILYWFLFSKNVTVQNVFILIANYVFYAFWDWRFLFLLIAYGLVNYFIGLKIGEATNDKRQKTWLWLALIAGFGILIFFKYTNFFINSFVEFLTLFHVHASLPILNIILPLGISFYTFQTLGYVLDVYKGKVSPTRNLLSFLTYTGFFPIVMSGPIERATNLLVQLQDKRTFNPELAKDGLRQMLWGLFKKIVIADNCALIVDNIFGNYRHASSFSLLFGAILFTIQLYADFSGYSEIAIGVAKLFGFTLVRNFAYPFFAQNIADFWRRWHMSLTSWLTEYLFTPLSIALRDYGKTGLIFSILLTYIIIGFWHGANWTFIVFGAINGIYYIPIILKGKLNKKTAQPKTKWLPALPEAGKMLRTFGLIVFAEIFFRSENVSNATNYIRRMFSASITQYNDLDGHLALWIFIIVMFFVEWIQRDKEHALQLNNKPAIALRWGIYTLLVFLIFFAGGAQQRFIYFQF